MGSGAEAPAVPMTPAQEARIAEAFKQWAAAKVPENRRPDAGDVVVFMIMVIGQSDESCSHDEVLALLRKRKAIS